MLAGDELFLLDMRRGEANSTWIIVKVHGPTPGKRYGHTLSFLKPYLVVFGGHAGAELQSDVWALSIEKVPFVWEKLLTNEHPDARIYHSASLCTSGPAAGTLLVFGGRAGDQTPLSDTWMLRRRKEKNVWDWAKAPYKRPKVPLARYQVKKLLENACSTARCS